MNRTRLDWTNFLFVSSAHLVAAFAVVYLAVFHFSWWTIGFGVLWGTLCGLSVTGGYHRLFSHSAYTATWPLRVFYLAFGAASVQNSALACAADHRTHHAHTDRDRDPYSIRRGFWWAHIGWVVCRSNRETPRSLVRDLEADPLVRFQHRFYVPLAILFGAVVPVAIGMAWGDPIGALLVAGWLRLVVQWHATFAVNSFAHLIGRQPYGRTGTARDSLIVAMLTMGEGYHNFHHRFQIDYRNGIRWYHFDPTKWWVWSAARLGLARGLRRVPAERVEAARRTARLQSER
ncbi:MAG: acyl-CoA desaturase [Planctomycetota bacterium]|jgi:stearoyl-CoA desaturase (delta-9 desaturase)